MVPFLKPLWNQLHRPSKSQVRVQILSDLHLELNQQYSSFAIPISAPFLILGGDIGRLTDYEGYLNFVMVQASRYQKVFLVLGNHEFYGLSYESGIEEARRLAQEPCLAGKLILLDRMRWDDPDSDLTVLGCTLWSEIPDRDRNVVESRINDFRMIRGWNAQRHNEAHLAEVDWLRNQVAQAASHGGGEIPRRILVVTHHAPCIKGTSRPEDAHNPWSSAFSTDLVARGGWDDVKVWVFGHTHYSTRFMKQGIEIVANQRGYVLLEGKGEVQGEKGHKFDPGMIITI
ncbi:Metallo-dependent phosphatase-like protein [Rostrohypoxylon terebratum]|nr:Metallo-dependent phosphatase-like protein [Rostrohypoxylon terebratum]